MKELALHMMDVAENGVRAGASVIRISIWQDVGQNALGMRIEDNGRGMDAEEAERAMDPFFSTRSTRRIGMGLPLFRQHAEMTGGRVDLQSAPGKGTCVEAVFGLIHPDRQPLGDIAGSWILLASGNPAISWELKTKTQQGDFGISTAEIKDSLEVEEISGHELLSSLKRLIRNNMEEIGLWEDAVEGKGQ